MPTLSGNSQQKTDLRNLCWIGPGEDVSTTETVPADQLGKRRIETAYFHHVFMLPVSNALLTVRVSASSRYRLWVNGTPVVSGPCKSGRWEKHYETVDVSPLLCKGENILALKVVAFPPYEGQEGDEHGPFWFMGNAAGPVMVLQGECLDANGQLLADVSTGTATWFSLQDTAVSWKMQTMSFWMGAMEVVDMEKLPDGWNTSVVSIPWVEATEKWKVASEGFGEMKPFPLSERPIPLCYEKPAAFCSEMPIRTEDVPSFTFGLPMHLPGQSHVVKTGGNQETNKAIKSADMVQASMQPHEANMKPHQTTKQPYQATIAPHQTVVIELDAGELTSAYLSMQVAGGKGSLVSLTYAENYADYSSGHAVRDIRDDSLNAEIQGNGDSFIASGREQTYEPFLFRTFRFVRILVETEDTPLQLSLPQLTETGYPLASHSKIDSSEAWIAPIWDMSRRTLQRCMHETYMDCPYYEQLQYTMDTRLQMIYTYALSGDDRLAKKAIYDYHASLLPEGMLQSRFPSDLPQVIPAFSLYWIFMLEEHWWQSGSTEQFKRYRPTVDAVLDWFDRKARKEDGLVTDLGHWDFADWVLEWDDRHGVPYAVDAGPSTIHNLVYAAALQSAAKMMKESGRSGVSEEYESRANHILSAIETLCWDETEGLYKGGPKTAEYTQHAQVWAVLTGLCSGEKAKRVMRNTLSRKDLPKCSFPWMYTMFRALEKADVYNETEQLWQLWKGLLNQNLTTIPEIPVNTRSDCHAWGALPLYEFTRNVLGVSPEKPGWDGVVIQPKALFLKDAHGEVVTPKGMVTVKWSVSDGQFSITGTLPDGSRGKVVLPSGEEYIQQNGGDFSYREKL